MPTAGVIRPHFHHDHQEDAEPDRVEARAITQGSATGSVISIIEIESTNIPSITEIASNQRDHQPRRNCASSTELHQRARAAVVVEYQSEARRRR